MSEVERLRPVFYDSSITMERDEHGDYVEFDHYQAALARIAELEAERDDFLAVLHRVVAAGDFYSQSETDGLAARYAHECQARLARAAIKKALEGQQRLNTQPA